MGLWQPLIWPWLNRDPPLKGEGNNGAISLSCIAKRQNLPLPYLEQIFNKLKKNGLVFAIKGAGGGYILAKAPEDISIFEIVEAVDKTLDATRCQAMVEGGCGIAGTKCLTHGLWAGLGNVVNGYLKSVSLSDIASKSKAVNNFLPDGCNADNLAASTAGKEQISHSKV